MDASTSTAAVRLPSFTWRAYGRRVFDHFREQWRQANVPTRFYAAGIAFVVLSSVPIWLRAPTWWIAVQLLGGAILASAGFVLEVYTLVDRVWDTKLGKLAGVLLGMMIAAVATALAQAVVNEATGIDPGHFPLTIAFVAPLTAGYLIAVFAWLTIVCGFVWFVVETLADMARSGWALGWGERYRPKNPTQAGLRFIAIVMMALLVATVWTNGQRPYASFLRGTASWFAYGLEMYNSDSCRLPTSRMRRLNDEVVLDGMAQGTFPTFRVRRCALGDVASPPTPNAGTGLPRLVR